MNLCFRASGYGVQGIEKQKSRERIGRCLYIRFMLKKKRREKPRENTKMCT